MSKVAPRQMMLSYRLPQWLRNFVRDVQNKLADIAAIYTYEGSCFSST